jgi:hypothetical protein
MKVIQYNSEDKTIKLVPRIFPNEGEILVVKLKNELTDEENIVNHTWSYINNYFTLTLEDNPFFKSNSYYYMTIHRENYIIYQGRVFIVSENTLIQDYSTTEIKDNKLKF